MIEFYKNNAGTYIEKKDQNFFFKKKTNVSLGYKVLVLVVVFFFF